MVYAYDLWAQLPVKDIYDTQMMLAHVSQVKDMYEKAALEMKDFKKEYGDFYSPIQKDMDWYRLNVTGRLLNKLNDLYNRGIDPLRSPEGRAELRMELNGIDTGAIAQLKQSAANATEFLKNQSKLQAAGLYNPLYAQYEGPSLNEYSTLGEGGQGVWNRMSPTPIQNIAEFGNPYFEGMKPNVHKESRNGVEYSVEAITMDDLRRIANSRFNDLVNTPQGQLMYKYFRDVTGDDTKARLMFNETVAAGQDRRIYTRDDFEDNYYKRLSLNLQRASHNLAERKFAWDQQKDREELELKRLKQEAELEASRGDFGGAGTKLSGFSLALRWYDTFAANAWSTGGPTRNWWEMGDNYGNFSKDADTVFYDFGQDVARNTKGRFNKALYDKDVANAKNEKDAINRANAYGANLTYLPPNKNDLKYYTDKISYIADKYHKRFTKEMDAESVSKIINPNAKGKIAQATEEDIDKLFGYYDTMSNTAGFTLPHSDYDTKLIRDAIKRYGVENTTIESLGRGYGALRKDNASFDVKPEVMVKIKDENGNVLFKKRAYYNIGLSSAETIGGAYISGVQLTGGTLQVGTPGLHLNTATMKLETNPVKFIPGGQYSAREFNLYPDYNKWAAFGPWDVRASHNLYATSEEKSAAY